MSMWGWVLFACAAAYALKLSGYLLPRSVLDQPFVPSLAGALTVGLLSSLVISNTVAKGQAVVLDSRLLGLGAAADIAGAYSYLAGDSSRWTTGSALVVDGGYSAP